ncbi:Uncharacterised protein [Chromobacterium violaceum]|uniref:Uncharacterized protein n=1 Tax=Chromobacterium violaceum TaxID=536 RepID=A0A447T472_CHRVL|nr:Uncharacterised protein [Chromobacterium violaceum]
MSRYSLLAGALLLAASWPALADPSIGNNGSQTLGMGALSILAAPVVSVGARRRAMANRHWARCWR